MAKMKKHSKHAECYATDIVMWDDKANCKSKQEVYLLAIYEEIDALYQHVDDDSLYSISLGSGL